jgi:hypothetical protein
MIKTIESNQYVNDSDSLLQIHQNKIQSVN